jgi:hypothetical protein
MRIGSRNARLNMRRFDHRGAAMLKVSKLVYFFATLISNVAVTSSEAKVLRSNTFSQTVLVFKDAEALSQFNRLADSVSHDESLLSRLLT